MSSAVSDGKNTNHINEGMGAFVGKTSKYYTNNTDILGVGDGIKQSYNCQMFVLSVVFVTPAFDFLHNHHRIVGLTPNRQISNVLAKNFSRNYPAITWGRVLYRVSHNYQLFVIHLLIYISYRRDLLRITCLAISYQQTN